MREGAGVPGSWSSGWDCSLLLARETGRESPEPGDAWGFMLVWPLLALSPHLERGQNGVASPGCFRVC